MYVAQFNNMLHIKFIILDLRPKTASYLRHFPVTNWLDEPPAPSQLIRPKLSLVQLPPIPF